MRLEFLVLNWSSLTKHLTRKMQTVWIRKLQINFVLILEGKHILRLSESRSLSFF